MKRLKCIIINRELSDCRLLADLLEKDGRCELLTILDSTEDLQEIRQSFKPGIIFIDAINYNRFFIQLERGCGENFCTVLLTKGDGRGCEEKPGKKKMIVSVPFDESAIREVINEVEALMTDSLNGESFGKSPGPMVNKGQ